MPKVKVNGIELNYEEHGRGDEPVDPFKSVVTVSARSSLFLHALVRRIEPRW